MRCKRCGELLEPGQTQCPVCGKAASSRRKSPAQKSGESSLKLPQLDKFTHIYNADVARSRTLQMVTIAAVVAVIALLVLVFVTVGDLRTAMDTLQRTNDDQLQAMQSQSQQSTSPDTEAQTQPEETRAPADQQMLSLSRQDVEATLTMYATDNDTYASADMDLGDFEDQVTAWISTDREDAASRTNVAWVLSQSGDRLVLKLSHSQGLQQDISMTWSLEGDTFNSLSGAVCTWEYRSAGGTWTSLPTDHITPVAGGCEVHLAADELTALLGQASQMELRCRVSLTHADGGTMRILAQGIVLGTEVTN